MSNINLPTKAILYYSSNVNALDNLNSFEFWFNSSLVRIIADKPFARGDTCNIVDIDPEERIIKVEVLDEVYDDIDEFTKLPILVFATSRIYFNKHSNFSCYSEDDNADILMFHSAVKDDNLSFCVSLLVKKGSAHIMCIDDKFDTETEFIINAKI